jgi:hypothetical protein
MTPDAIANSNGISVMTGCRNPKKTPQTKKIPQFFFI